MSSISSVPRSSRKRNLALTPSSAVALGLEEPATQRARRDVLSTQLETLQAELDHERSLRSLDQKRFQQSQQRLERQVEFAVEEAKEAKALMEEIREQSEDYAQALKSKQRALQLQCQELQYELDMARNEAAEDMNEESPQVAVLQEQLEYQKEETRGLRKTIKQLQQELEQANKDRDAAMNSRSYQENTTPSSTDAPPQVMKELNAVRIELQEEQRKNRQLHRQATQLQAKNKEVRQEMLAQQAAAQRLSQLEEQLQERDRALALAQAQVATWNEFGANMSQLLVSSSSQDGKQAMRSVHKPGIPPEISVIQRYLQDATKEARDKQTQNQALETQLEAADDKLQELQRTIRELEQSKVSLKKDLENAKHQQSIALDQVQVLENQKSVWDREMTTLRSIVKTFDELPLPGKDNVNQQEMNAQMKMLKASLDATKEELEVIKEAKNKIQATLDTALAEKAELQSTHNTVLEKFGKLKEAVYAERAKSEKAEARAVHAEELAGKGSFNPETTRVMHMQANPLTEALKQEVNVLRRQVEALTSSKNKAKKGAVTPGSDVDPNKLHQRLKESFKEQIGRFREGVYLLTGFKIDMIPEGERPKFKVRSMFAEREEDHLMFQWPKVSHVESLDLLDTELAKLLTTTPSYEYITRFHSLPAFLSSTQLSLFEKQTMM